MVAGTFLLDELVINSLNSTHYEFQRFHKDAEIIRCLEQIELKQLGRLLLEFYGVLAWVLASQEMEKVCKYLDVEAGVFNDLCVSWVLTRPI